MEPFRVVVADPPWKYKDGMWQRPQSKATNHYSTLSLAEICALPVEQFMADDAYLFLWTTNRKLVEGWSNEVATAWGFRALTFMVWIKPWMGLGNYFRNCHENVVLGVRGSPGQFKYKNWKSWFMTDQNLGHSAKPVELIDAIETHTDGPYLELFAREGRPGWTSWGQGVGDPLNVGFDPSRWGCE